MKALFGIPTFNIMILLVAILGVAIATVVIIGLTNRTIFRMGLRNLSRRGLQTALIVTGLALATLITTAAFVTGDTIDHTLRSDSTELFGRADLDITWNGERDFVRDAGAATLGDQVLVTGDPVGALEAAFADDADIAGFVPFLLQRAPVTDTRSGRVVAAAQLTGVDVERLAAIGGLTLSSGAPANVQDLAGDNVLLSERAADELDARAGDLVTIHLGGEAHTFQVVAIVRNEVASGVLGRSYSSVPGGIVLELGTMQTLYGYTRGEISSIIVSLASDDRLAAATPVAERMTAFIKGEGSAMFVTPDGTLAAPEAFATRKDVVEQSEESANLFAGFFLILGLFSIAAGVILIFMIFVMLAAERRPEIGMSRAVGAQRSHLVQAFIVEGMAYSLLAGVIGVVAGVAASFGLTVILLPAVGGDYFSLVEPDVTPVALVIGYSLGVVITFVTVVAASAKVSRVNIVAAIRDLPDQPRREGRRGTRWGWVAAGLPAMILPPVGVWLLFRKGLGLPWAWILSPAGLVLGALSIMAGQSSESMFLFSFGVSLLPLSAAAIAGYFRVPGRTVWTMVGVLLAAYWLLPAHVHSELFGEFSSNLEMFFLSGVMIVVSFTLIIVFNARTITAIFGGSDGRAGRMASVGLAVAAVACAVAGKLAGNRFDGTGELLYLVAGILIPAAGLAYVSVRFPSVAPALKMGVAYPLANRFRTGMTIAMFSIIVFSLTVFSILLAFWDVATVGDEARANLDVVGSATTAAPAMNLERELAAAGSPVAGQIAGVGLSTLAMSNQAVADPAATGTRGVYPVIGVDEGFLTGLGTALESYANSYASEAEVFAAIQSTPGLALVDASVIDGAFNDSYHWVGPTVPVTDGRFEPFEVEIVNTATGETATVTVIGTLKIALEFSTIAGVYVNETTYTGVFGEPSYQRFWLRLDEGVDAEDAAVAIESTLATKGVQADSIAELLQALSAQTTAFNRMFQAFVALGLVVGLAGLGVISYRSVVERRQQIGMLRAIGYQRGTVTLTFLLESSFVAVMGILTGIVGGAVIGKNLLASPEFAGDSEVVFTMPWEELVAVAVASLACSLLMTWWPSRGASRVPVAEALRYE